jgi:uncharacterized protein YheU (UPF0270 family)
MEIRAVEAALAAKERALEEKVTDAEQALQAREIATHDAERALEEKVADAEQALQARMKMIKTTTRIAWKAE